MTSLIAVSPSDPAIATLADMIAASTVTCTGAEKAKLADRATILEEGVDSIAKALETAIGLLEGELGTRSRVSQKRCVSVPASTYYFEAV